MKIFVVTLTMLFIFCQNCLALTAKDKSNQQETQQKMDQLKQLLAQVSKNDNATAPATNALPDSLAPPSSQTSAPALALAPAPTETKSAATTVNTQQSNMYDEAFAGVVNQQLPMTPSQIMKLREVFTENQLAAATIPGVPPKPTSSSLLIDLSPQAVAPVVRLKAGFITSMVFIDATGQPWPIAAYSVGDPAAFGIQWDHKGNTLLVQSSTFYKSSNLAVILRDLNTPVMITLMSGQEAVDYRVDLRVPGAGPNAVYVQNGIPAAVNPILFDVLNGIPPQGSKELKITGSGINQAWQVGEKLYLRTNLTVTSPGYQSTMSSVDGTHAYQLQLAPIIKALQNGKDKILTLSVEGLEYGSQRQSK